MAYCRFCNRKHNVGFISTRLAGTDGVSLETAKWAEVFERVGFACYYFAGELDRPAESSYIFREAHFQHPDISELFQKCFGVRVRGRAVTQKIYELKRKLKDHLYKFIEKFEIDLLDPGKRSNDPAEPAPGHCAYRDHLRNRNAHHRPSSRFFLGTPTFYDQCRLGVSQHGISAPPADCPACGNQLFSG